MTNTIRPRKQLLALADENGVIRRGRWAVRVWPGGHILREDIDPDQATLMTVKQAVKHLGIK